MFVFVVDPYFVMQDRVEADVAEIGDGFHRTEIIAVALAQSEDGAARSKHLFPEMREWRGLSVRVDFDVLLFRGLQTRNSGDTSDDYENDTKISDSHDRFFLSGLPIKMVSRSSGSPSPS